MDSFSLPGPNISLNKDDCRSLQFDDIYHSKDGALEEAAAVFILGNNLAQRWENLESDFCVAELGFGFGVSFLACAKEWASIEREHYLNFVSIEGFPVSNREINDYLMGLNSDPESYLIKTLLDQYPLRLRCFQRIHFPKYKICLTLIFDEVSSALSKIDFAADAWFLDGFSPSKNPEMWSEEVLKLVFKNTRCGGSFSTYSVSRLVKGSAQNAGFEIKTLKGFKSKKQMLIGKKIITPKTLNLQNKPIKKIAIIGGGIAGASLAHALCLRGHKVTVIEKNSGPALGASGNKSAVIMPLLSSKIDNLTEFYLAGFLHTIRVLEEINTFQKLDTLKLDGALRLASVKKWKSVMKNLNALGLDLIADSLSFNEIASRFKIFQENDGLFFLKGGMIEPAELIRSIFLRHTKNLVVKLNSEVIQLVKNSDHYQIITNDNTKYEFETVVIANAYAAAYLKQSAWLPVEKIKGQLFTTLLEPDSKLSKLNFPVCYDGYVSPTANSDRIIIGATYEHNKHEELFNPDVIEDLSSRLQNNTGIIPSRNIKNIEGKVCFRTTSPDRLPMIGALNDREGNLIENLFVSVGHGSRGMISCFLAAEVIADQINNAPAVLAKHILSEVSPMRFLLRERRRGVKLNEIYPASYIWR